MVVVAFVLINAEIGAEREVLEDLKAIQEIREAHLVHGVYDLIARVEVEYVQGLKDVVAFKIRHLDKVHSTLTLICI